MPEEVYAIINDSMPDLIKIGGGDTQERLAEANKASTWMPTFYKVALVKDVHVQWAKKEHAIHLILDDIRIPSDGKGRGTEWFKNDFERIKKIFDALPGEYIDISIFNSKYGISKSEKVDNIEEESNIENLCTLKKCIPIHHIIGSP